MLSFFNKFNKPFSFSFLIKFCGNGNEIQEATKEIVDKDSMLEITKMTISSFDSKLTRQLVCYR